MTALVLRQVRVTCDLCGQSCQTYASPELVDAWADRWASEHNAEQHPEETP